MKYSLFVLSMLLILPLQGHAGLFDPPTKAEIAQFKRSCWPLVIIATKKNEIPIWKLRKDPVEYTGTKLKFRARVLDSWGRRDITWIKVDLSDGHDLALINIEGHREYKIKSIIQVYGIATGRDKITTEFGGFIYVPSIEALELHIAGSSHDRLY
jgi:hypothetical protein